MQVLYRFIESLSAAPTSVYNQLLAIGDKPSNIFSKLQGLLSIRQLRQVNVAAVSGGASTTADVNIVQLIIPGNRLNAADVFNIRIDGSYTKNLSVGSNINFWIKINGVKIVTLTHTPNNSRTNLPFYVNASLLMRAVGSNAVAVVNSDGAISTSATATTLINSLGGVANIDSTANVTITAGFNFSNSNASNNVTASHAVIIQE